MGKRGRPNKTGTVFTSLLDCITAAKELPESKKLVPIKVTIGKTTYYVLSQSCQSAKLTVMTYLGFQASLVTINDMLDILRT